MASKAPSISDMLSVAASAARSSLRAALRHAFSAEDVNSRPNAAQLEILKGVKDYLIRIVKAGNQSGKSRTCARDLTWLLNREHPYIDVTKEWGPEPLMALVAGADRTILTTNIWQQMIKPLLADPTEWKENNSNDGIKSAVNRRTGDQIIFLTHNKGSEEDIRHLMSYAANFCWVDEIPKTAKVIEELTRRIDAKRGRLIMSYTMKFRNDAMRKSIAAMDATVTKLYRLAKLDNPIYADRKDEELAKISHLSKEEQAVILYGDDILSDTAIHSINYDLMVRPIPASYDTAWPHILVVDPATESKLGMLVAAYQQSTGLWFIVQDKYVEGLYAPSKIVAEVERRVIGLNIIDRFYDTAASWYKQEAKILGFKYKPIKEKAGSKERWIMDTNQALGTRVIICDHCETLLDECEQYQRVPGSTNIQNPKKFHAVDSLHYLVEALPDMPAPPQDATYWEQFHAAVNASNQRKRDRMEAKVKAAKQGRVRKLQTIKRGYSSWR